MFHVKHMLSNMKYTKEQSKDEKRNKKINLKKQKETCYSEKPNSMQKRRRGRRKRKA